MDDREWEAGESKEGMHVEAWRGLIHQGPI